MPMSNSGARIVDPVLSNLALGYRNNEFIAHHLFPFVACPKRGVRVIKFGKESFRLANTRRAPGADTARVMYGYESDPVSLHQESLEAVVPFEWVEEAADIPVDIASVSVNNTMDRILLGHEVRAAALAQDASNYAASNKASLTADYWDDASTDLSAQIAAARAAVRKKIGRNPNVLELPNDVFEAAKRNTLIREQFKYTSSESITAAMMANYFDVEKVVIGRALYLPETAQADASMVDIWQSIVCSYVPPEALRNIGVPSYGYSYRLNNYPIVEQSYADRRAKSHIYPVTDEISAELTGMEAGFLITSPMTP